jgi:predicted metalloprotease with PDZ domain
MPNKLIRRLLLPCLLAMGWPALAASTSFALDYRIELEPASGEAHVVIATAPADGRLVRVGIPLPRDRYRALRADGDIDRDGDDVTWTPPRAGGTLQYRVRVDHERRGVGYDARMTDDWALLRGDDLVPPLRATVTRGADSRARLRFILPAGWSVETPYARSADGKAFVIVDPERRMDRPEGWMIFGRLGVRRDHIAGMRVAVAAPLGQNVHRADLLAFVTSLGPQLRRAFGELPSRLLLVQAGDPMWRGGLSGPRSLYLHQDRPLLSENGSSTPAHELVHVVTRLRGADGDDWIAEGLAEYYSIELTRRAGLLSDRRAQKALAWMRDHGRGVERLHTDRSSGQVTARAVTLLAALDAEIQGATEGRSDLDDVVRRLIPQREVSREALREAAREVLGREAKALRTPLLD